MNNEKKTLVICNYHHNEPNSVSEILKELLETGCLKQKSNTLISRLPDGCAPQFSIEHIDGWQYVNWTSCASRNNKNSPAILKKITLLFRALLRTVFFKKSKVKCLMTVKKVFDFKRVVLLVAKPDKFVCDFLAKGSIRFIILLYDSLLDNPKFNHRHIKKIEQKMIDLSTYYYVPSFFYDKYRDTYRNAKIKSYNLPLLLPINDVLDGYKNAEGMEKYDFAYFGQLQSFRGFEKVLRIFEGNKKVLDVFTNTPGVEDSVSSKNIRFHKPVTGRDLRVSLAKSRFLVVLDNSAPYENYLPSKVYLYVSFTKPIIIIGDNKKSATISFFKNYKSCFYQDVNDSCDGLLSFITDHWDSGCFSEDLYLRYSQYLPENALKGIFDDILYF